MARGKFEEGLSKKFEGQSAPVSNSLWENIEAELDKGLVASYASKNRRYKWAAIAAILIAFMSFSYQIIQFSERNSKLDGAANYNALLSHDYHTPAVDPIRLSGGGFPAFFRPVIVKREQIESGDPMIGGMMEETESYATVLDMPNLVSKGYITPEVEVQNEISRYAQAPSYRQLSRSAQRESGRLWAGLEAGAGNFNSSSAGSVSPAVDPIGLASAIGNDGFINPSTAVNSNVDNGVATSLGLDFGMNIGNKWTLGTGIAYTNVSSNGNANINVLDSYTLAGTRTLPLEGDEIILASSARESEIVVEENYDHNVAVTSSTQFTSVPLKAGYFVFDSRMSLRLNVGVAANYLVTNELSGGDGLISSRIDGSLNQWSFDGLGGVEIGYSVSDNFDFVLEPNYRHAITPMNILSGANTSRFIVQTGLKYTLQ